MLPMTISFLASAMAGLPSSSAAAVAPAPFKILRRGKSMERSFRTAFPLFLFVVRRALMARDCGDHNRTVAQDHSHCGHASPQDRWSEAFPSIEWLRWRGSLRSTDPARTSDGVSLRLGNKKPNLLKGFNLICPVQPAPQKHFAFLRTQISCVWPPSRPARGTLAIVTNVGTGGCGRC